jgi:hypothetical protein
MISSCDHRPSRTPYATPILPSRSAALSVIVSPGMNAIASYRFARTSAGTAPVSSMAMTVSSR